MRSHVLLISLLTLCIGLTVWITNMDKIGVMHPFTYEALLVQARRHLELVFLAEVIAIFIGVPLGILVTRRGFKKLATPVIGAASVAYAIPTLVILVLMVPLIGLGFKPAVVALIICGVLPILRNSYVAINNINPAIVEAARGMGMTRGQIAWKIELPLAVPVIITGIRISTVLLVGTAALAAFIAAGGLGHTIIVGVESALGLITLQGAAPIAALAIILSFILGCIEKWMTPRGLKVKAEIS